MTDTNSDPIDLRPCDPPDDLVEGPGVDPDGWTVSASGIRTSIDRGLETDEGLRETVGREFASHSLTHLATTWDPVGDPGEGSGGCWRHTFQLSSFGVHAQYQHDGGDDMRSKYRLGYGSHPVEGFSANEVTIETGEAVRTFPNRDYDAEPFPDASTYGDGDQVAVSTRRDESLFGFMDPVRFINQFEEETETTGQYRMTPLGEGLARQIVHSQDPSSEGNYPNKNLSELKAKMRYGSAVGKLYQTAAFAAIGAGAAVFGPMGVAVAGLFELLASSETKNGDSRAPEYNRGVEIGSRQRQVDEQAAGTHVVFDVYASPCSKELVSVESWFGQRRLSAGWVIETGGPDADHCSDDSTVYPESADPADTPPEERPQPRPIPAAHDGPEYLNFGTDPSPVLEVVPDDDRHVFDASLSTGSAGRIEQYEFTVRRNHPTPEVQERIRTDDPHACLDTPSSGNYQVDLRVAERDPEDGTLVWNEGTVTRFFTVDGATATITEPSDWSWISTDETVTLDATDSILPAFDGSGTPGGKPFSLTWSLRHGGDLLWERTTSTLSIEVPAKEIFGRAIQTVYDLHLRLETTDGADETSVSLVHVPNLQVDVVGDDGPLQSGAKHSFTAEVAGPTDPVDYTWEMSIDDEPFFEVGSGQSYTAEHGYPGQYTLRATATVGDATARDTVSFEVVDGITVDLDPPSDPELGDEVTLEPTVTATVGDVEYDWHYQLRRSPYYDVGASGPTYTPPSFSSPGHRAIKVVVTDDQTSATASCSFTVEDPPLSVSLDGPSDPELGQSHTFEPSVSGAEGEVTYEWDLSVNGGGYQPVNAGEAFALSFDAAVPHTVKVTASDDDESGTAVAEFAVDPSSTLRASLPEGESVEAGESYRLTPTVYGTSGSETYEWDVDGSDAGSGRTLSTTFSSRGTHEVTVTVSEGGRQATASTTVTATEALTDLSGAIANAPSTVSRGETLTVEADVSGGEGDLTYSWAVVPASTNRAAVGQGTGERFTHTFSNTGDYEVHLSATDAAGQSVDDSSTVTVEDHPLSVSISGPTTATDGDSTTYSAQTGNATGDVDYDWSISKDGSRAVSMVGKSISQTLVGPSTYSITVTASDDTDSASDSVSVTVESSDGDGGTSDGGSSGGSDDGSSSDGPLAVSISGPTTATDGDAVTYEAQTENATGDVDYDWSISKDGSRAVSMVGQSISQTLVGPSTYSISVSGTDDTDTTGDSVTVTVEADDTTDSGSTDDGSTSGGSTDDGSTDDGSTDDGTDFKDEDNDGVPDNCTRNCGIYR